MASLTGKILGPFEVEGEIGRGGMGIVYRASQTNLERPAVLKQLRRDLAEQEDLVERFRREARAAAAVHHHNVVAVYDCFAHRGNQYIAQEYVDGVDLRSVLERAGDLPWRIAALIALEAARGLEAIHEAGTVHRDLKPANLLLGRRGEVKIADFGIALEAHADAITRPGILLGSPPYMPPEQLLGERLDARGDLFSLGVVFYEMLAGVPPYGEPKDEASETWLTQMQKERYPRLRKLAPATPRDVARLVKRMLRARPRNRLATASELRGALERRLGHPSGADCRSEIARWLWSHSVFEQRKHETIVMVAPVPALGHSAARRFGLALLAMGVLFASVLIVDVRPSPERPTCGPGQPTLCSAANFVAPDSGSSPLEDRASAESHEGQGSEADPRTKRDEDSAEDPSAAESERSAPKS